LKVPPRATASETIDVSFALTNTGAWDGDEVAQLYVKQLNPAKDRPQQQLKGFSRVPLRKGETKTVHLSLTLGELGFWDASTHKYRVEPGSYQLMIGASSADIRQQATIDISP
jgi:beta-glucosidase